MSTTDTVHVEARAGVGIISINRPEVRNAINQEAAEAVAEAVDKFESRSDIRVLILTGAGGTFCAGMDLKAFLRGERPTVGNRGLAGLTRYELRKPLIAAVEGYALAGGFELALSADMIVAAENAQFGLPEVRRGLVAAGGGLLRVAKALPFGVGMAMSLTGEPMTAASAREYGLVVQVCPEGEALATAVSLAERIATNAPLAIAATKQIIHRAARWLDEDEHDWMHQLAEPVLASNDAQEGAAAFAERRSPKWTGR